MYISILNNFCSEIGDLIKEVKILNRIARVRNAVAVRGLL